ncbi:MAG TPA: hypothetical protein VD846_01000 [Allosphingosinicella sp.]|nr:hypothetical protein [Allosphingosinicella sp.]
MKKIDIALLPHLKTGVGIHGSLKQQEVGGAACVAAVVAIVSGSGSGPGAGLEPLPALSDGEAS